MINKFLTFLISFYQKNLSPDHGFLSLLLPVSQRCRYVPTCSQYTKEALSKFSLGKALYLSMVRIFHCHPFSKRHTYDPVPEARDAGDEATL